jgi:hypothetical protein
VLLSVSVRSSVVSCCWGVERKEEEEDEEEDGGPYKNQQLPTLRHPLVHATPLSLSLSLSLSLFPKRIGQQLPRNFFFPSSILLSAAAVPSSDYKRLHSFIAIAVVTVDRRRPARYCIQYIGSVAAAAAVTDQTAAAGGK